MRTCQPYETWDETVCDCVCTAVCDRRTCGLLVDNCVKVRDCDCNAGSFCNGTNSCVVCPTAVCPANQCGGNVTNICGTTVQCNRPCNGTCTNNFCVAPCSPPSCPTKQCGGYISNPCGQPIPCSNACNTGGGESCTNDFCSTGPAAPAACVPPSCPSNQCGGFIANPCGDPIACAENCTSGYTCSNNFCAAPPPPVCVPPTCPARQCSGIIPPFRTFPRARLKLLNRNDPEPLRSRYCLHEQLQRYHRGLCGRHLLCSARLRYVPVQWFLEQPLRLSCQLHKVLLTRLLREQLLPSFLHAANLSS